MSLHWSEGGGRRWTRAIELELGTHCCTLRHIFKHFLSCKVLELAKFEQFVEVLEGLVVVLKLLIGPASVAVSLDEQVR